MLQLVRKSSCSCAWLPGSRVGDQRQVLAREVQGVSRQFDLADQRTAKVLRAERWNRTLCRAQRTENSGLPVARSPMSAFRARSLGRRPASTRSAAARSSARVSHSTKEVLCARVEEHEAGQVQRQCARAQDARVKGQAGVVRGHDVHAAFRMYAGVPVIPARILSMLGRTSARTRRVPDAFDGAAALARSRRWARSASSS